MTQIHIPTFIINLQNRVDRKEHILKEFTQRGEFSVNIVEPLPHEIGAVSLWSTIKHIIKNLAKENKEYILICEDDHQFTDFYSKELLDTCITEAMAKGADILLGGVHWFNSALCISDNIFWVDKFTGAQFTIIFRNFFKTILEADFGHYDVADLKISHLTKKKFFISPFISVQKDFGYSDATPKNNEPGKMQRLFGKTSANVQTLKQVEAYYKKNKVSRVIKHTFEKLTIPTYIICQSKKSHNRDLIERVFNGKTEFDTKLVKRSKHEIAAIGLWLSIRKIVALADKNEDDVIIICEDNHEFTENYSKNFLFQNIIEGHEQGAGLMIGSVYSFGLVVPISKSRFWVNHFYGARFLILFRSVFKKILDEPFNVNLNIDFVLSDITSNKMLLYPFVSKQKVFDNDDFAAIHDSDGEVIVSLLEEASSKILTIRESASVYGTCLNQKTTKL